MKEKFIYYYKKYNMNYLNTMHNVEKFTKEITLLEKKIADMNINYDIVNKKRKFHKGWVNYINSYAIDDGSSMGDNGLYYDGEYIVSFIRSDDGKN